jgi:hypothetical protein
MRNYSAICIQLFAALSVASTLTTATSQNTLLKRQSTGENGDGTYHDYTGAQASQTACNLFPSAQQMAIGLYPVAINQALFSAIPACKINPNKCDLCGKIITITNNENGKQAQAMICDTNSKPGSGDLDIDTRTWALLDGNTAAGHIPVSWQFGSIGDLPSGDLGPGDDNSGTPPDSHKTSMSPRPSPTPSAPAAGSLAGSGAGNDVFWQAQPSVHLFSEPIEGGGGSNKRCRLRRH